MKTSKCLSLRGNADSTKLESAPPAYQYDAEGRVTHSSSTGQWQYPTYNALGQRVEDYQGTASTSMKLYYPRDISGDRTGIWDDHSSVGWVGWDVYWSQVAGQRLNMGGASAYIDHSDAVGSTTMETDPAGGMQWDMTHYPWGQVWQQGGTRQTGVYAGLDWQVNDPVLPSATRELSPALGRWMTPDALGGDVTNPQSLNRYAYVLNNPTTLTDPLGLFAGNPADQCNSAGYTDARCQGPPGCSWLGNTDCCPDIGGDNAELCDPMIGDLPPPVQWNPLPPVTPPTAAGQLGALGGGSNFNPAVPIEELGACALAPELCTALTVITVVSVAYESYELWKHRPPAAGAEAVSVSAFGQAEWGKENYEF